MTKADTKGPSTKTAVKKKQRYRVFRAQTGLGLLAVTDFKKGEKIIDYTGRLITNEQADEHPNRYLFRLDETHTIDGAQRDNLARYINHSCKPNAQAVHHEKKRKIYIEAIKKIRAGDEITFDYGPEYFEAYIEPIGCKCPKCQKKAAKAEKK